MQIINSLQLRKLPVYTKDGDFVGRVMDFDIDKTTFKITALHVRINSIVPFFGRHSLITSDQIIEVTDRAVIIDQIIATDKITNTDLGLVAE